MGMGGGINGVEGAVGRTPFMSLVDVAAVVVAIKRTAGEERIGVVGEPAGRTMKAWLVVAMRRNCSNSGGSSRHVFLV